MNALEIEKMSTAQRLQAMEILWDALLHDKVDIESPGWHQNVLEKRKERIAGGGKISFLEGIKSNARRMMAS